MDTKKYNSIDAYISDFSGAVSDRLSLIRETILMAAPDAVETISYNMPAFRQDKILVYFAAFKNHIGLYALPSGNKAFENELSSYKTGKGSIQFPHNQALPVDLIKKIVKYRVKEVEANRSK